MQRRDFIKRTAAVAAWSQLHPVLRAQQKTSEVSILIDPHKPLRVVPPDFSGLSYESAQLSHPQFFSEENRDLVGLVKRLSPQGILRIGGNTSSQTRWSAKDVPLAANGVANPATTTAFSWDKTAPEYVITPAAIHNLRGFLDATGWRLIYGLNLENGTAAAAAEEAAFVAQAMGDKLVALQFGNEPDLFRNDDAAHSNWTYEEYATRWLQFEAAVRARLGNIPLAGPDVAFKMDWVTQFARQMRGKVTLLTGHYYIGGPPANPAMNIAALLAPPKHLLDEIPQAMAAAKVAGVPYRMAEGNSIYQGGKRGVSDTFASALWAGDYMLQLAHAGYCGVNLHGGGEGIYTPITTDNKGVSAARPEYYGILLAQMFAGSTLMQCDVETHGANAANVTAYAGESGGKTLLAIFNKQADKVKIRLRGMKPRNSELWWLRAPSVDSKTGVTFAGSSVGNTGEFVPQPEVVHGAHEIAMEPYSAVVVTG